MFQKNRIRIFVTSEITNFQYLQIYEGMVEIHFRHVNMALKLQNKIRFEV